MHLAALVVASGLIIGMVAVAIDQWVLNRRARKRQEEAAQRLRTLRVLQMPHEEEEKKAA